MRSSLSQQIQSSLMFTNVASRNLVEAQNHAVSGKRILRPSDDVPGTNRALSLRSAINTVDQFTNNIVVCKPLLAATEGALNDLCGVVREIRDIAVAAGNAAATDTAKEAYAKQLDAILAKMADIANTKHTDQFLFSGTATGTPAVREQVGTPPYTYQGNSGTRHAQVLSWVSLSLNIPGDKLFNFDGSAGAGTTDMFTMVTDLRDAIRNGTTNDVSSQLTNIDANLDNLLANTARVGSWMARMDGAKDLLADTKIRLQEMLSDTEDVDLPEAVVKLKTQENVYQTALAITSRMLDLSLASLQRM